MIILESFLLSLAFMLVILAMMIIIVVMSIINDKTPSICSFVIGFIIIWASVYLMLS